MATYYDSSGQVYTESVSTASLSMTSRWPHHARGRRDDPCKHTNGSGCSTLSSMALRACVWHVDSMEPEALKWLEWYHASQIYRQLKAHDSMSFHIWSIFHQAFPDDIDRHHNFTIIDSHASSSALPLFPSLVTRLAKLDTTVLTHLCMSGLSLSLEHLLNITKISKLASLVLQSTPGSSIDTRDIRNWCRAVQENGTFKNLTFLVMHGVNSSEEAILQSVSCFPRLVLVGSSLARGYRRVPDSGPIEGSHSWLPEKDMVGVRTLPSVLWTNPRASMERKLRLLHQKTQNLVPIIDRSKENIPCITVRYCGSDRSAPIGPLVWSFRTLPEQTEQPIRRAVSSRQQKPDEREAKKRRIRSNKQVDMTSFLSNMG